ncbi:MAG: hypothetical protein KAI64_00160, partial [Thermoplasmata archaeon]|nr:hypothetical protein [Thermoplasmata archaeon]
VAAAVDFTGGMYLSANASLNDNYFADYTEYGYDGSSPVEFDRSNNTIANFPVYLINGKVGYRGNGISAFFHTRFIGKQFLDNSESDDFSIEGYSVENLLLSYDFRHVPDLAGLTAQLHVNNLFDTEYETHGFVDSGIAYFVPAAGRNVYLTLSAGF